MIHLRQHFGFTRVPFAHLDARHPFESDDLGAVQKALSQLFLTGGIALCAGEPGTGKTFAVDAFTETLNRNEVTVHWIEDAGESVGAFLRRSVRALGIAPAYGSETVYQQLVDGIREHYSETARHLLFVLDEAQQLPPAVLEQLRRLTNLGHRRPLPLSYVLIAHRDLLAPLGQQHLTALRRRLRATVTLGGLSREEIGPYVTHHLTHAGCSHPLFGEDVIDLLFGASRGLPRLIGTLSLAALARATTEGRSLVETSTLRAVLDEMEVCP